MVSSAKLFPEESQTQLDAPEGTTSISESDRNYRMGSATEMMINDLDDERTLDEEEALEGSEDSHNELSNLQKEGDMPLKELLAKYGYSQRSAENSEGSDQIMQDEERLESIGKDEALGDDYEEEEEEDEDEEEVEDDEEDEDEDGNGVKAKLSGDKMFKQLSLREFYLEMIKMDAKRMCIAGDNAEDDGGRENVDESLKEIDPSLSNRGEMVDDNLGEDNHLRSRVNDGTTSNNENSSSQSGGNPLGGDGSSGRVNDGTTSNNENASSRSGANPVGGAGGSGGGAEGGGSGGGGGGGGGSSRLLRSVSRPQSEEEDDDCDYSPDEEEWKKTIMVGSDYQATIPEGLCKYDDALPYENEDKILWNPCFISKKEVEEFLERAQLPNAKSTTTNTLPTGGHIRDDEQALYLLLQCGYNLEEALRRRRMNVLPPTDAISLWSEEECHNFESGLRTYGKDFHLIQRNKVRTRSVGELVQFYYLWKKTERHDIFTYKARMEKKKYALHPGITIKTRDGLEYIRQFLLCRRDYMDRFLEEQEGVRDRSSSPNVNCLLYGDAKRQRGSVNTLANNHSEEVKSMDTWDGVTTDESLGDLNNMNMSTGTTTTTTTSTAGGTASGNMSSTTSSSPLVSSSSVTSASGTKTTDSIAGTTSSSNSTNRKNADGISTNHNHDTPRHGYSPSPETILSNLPP